MLKTFKTSDGHVHAFDVFSLWRALPTWTKAACTHNKTKIRSYYYFTQIVLTFALQLRKDARKSTWTEVMCGLRILIA